MLGFTLELWQAVSMSGPRIPCLVNWVTSLALCHNFRTKTSIKLYQTILQLSIRR